MQFIDIYVKSRKISQYLDVDIYFLLKITRIELTIIVNIY